MLYSDTMVAVAPVVAQLEHLGVAYYLGGSIVSSAFGIPRSTLDVDLVADLGLKHVAPLVEALQSTYYIDAHMISDAILRKSCFNVIHLPTSFKVDVFALKGREYDRTAMERRVKKSIDPECPSTKCPSTEFFLASPEDIVLSKLEWFRLGEEVSEQQWRDVIGVLKVRENLLDRKYLQKWAAELGIADLLEKAWRQLDR